MPDLRRRDVVVLIAARGLRMLANGFLSVLLALYLAGIGYSIVQIGLLFTITLAGGAVATTGVSLWTDRWGRRPILTASALLMAAGGAVLAAAPAFPPLLILAVFGTLSPSGQDVGPAQPLEQASLSGGAGANPVFIYAWYNLVGYAGMACGALVAGVVPAALQQMGWAPLAAQRTLVWTFAAIGLVVASLYATLSPSMEAPAQHASKTRIALHRSRGTVLKLSALFGVDALAGGLVVQSLVAFWFHQRFGVGLDRLGPLFFGTNLLSALSGLAAARLANRFGLLNTMVVTHLPSNLLLALVPFMPSWPLAAAVLLTRHALSQMDVPTRQAYTMVLVAPDERTAAAGITNAVRPAAASLAPVMSGIALQASATGLPFVLSGGLKVLYDVVLWRVFRGIPIDAPPASSIGPEPPADPSRGRTGDRQ